MTYNRRWIMHRAWELVHQWNPRRVTPRDLARALRFAWRDAKAKLAGKVLPDELSPTERALAAMESKNRLSDADHRRMEELRQAVAHEKAEPEYAQRRSLIASAKGRFASVTFIKKDGTERVMRVQPAKLRRHVKGRGASQPAQRAAETRSERHPHLLPVWDTEKAAPRSVNLATVTRIAVNGSIHVFRAV